MLNGLSDIFSLDYNETLNKVNSESNVETIIQKVEKDKIDEFKKWMEDNKITIGINIDEDSKRSYPYNTLASNLLGFCGSDNQGLGGIELKWNNILTGTPGKIVTSKDAISEEIPDQDQQYIEAENGSNLVLTLDINVQTIIEKYLKQAVEEYSCSRGGNVIVMNPNTGDILGMATYPDYNLNTPFEPNTSSLKDSWDTLSSAEKTTSLQKMWRNKAISDTYEPGSTFKLITAAVALEENITQTDVANNYVCIGYEDISGTKISCWSPTPHGYLTLRQALQKSCNPAFMQLGKKIGTATLYKYYNAFGLFNKTGVDISGETVGIFHDENNVGPVELATMSFGQRFTITPLQLITAVSAIANDGKLMKPRIVKQVINADTNAVTNIDTLQVRQVISKETSTKMKSLMESVVTDGSGRYAAVKGYSVGGKTGTSEPQKGKESEGYIASYIAISPTEKPEVVVLVTLYGLTGKNYQGGQVAGPVVSQILTELLPYLGVASDSSESSSDTSQSSTQLVPDVTNKTVAEAKKVLENSGFKCNFSTKGNINELLVTDQVPKPGVSLPSNSLIRLYTQENNVRTSVTVPNLKGMSATQAMNALKSKNLNIVTEGSGSVISQDPAYNSSVEEGSIVKVILSEQLKDAH